MVCYDVEKAEEEFFVHKSPRTSTRAQFQRTGSPSAGRQRSRKVKNAPGGIRQRRNRRWSW